LDFALKKGSKDNMTAILITLPGIHFKQKHHLFQKKDLQLSPPSLDENKKKYLK